MSVRTTDPILDMTHIRLMESMNAYHLIQDCHLSYTTMNYSAVNTVQALGEDLSQRQTGDANNTFQGCVQDCQTAIDLMEGDAKGHLDQNNYGQGSLEKAVAARVIDRPRHRPRHAADAGPLGCPAAEQRLRLCRAGDSPPTEGGRRRSRADGADAAPLRHPSRHAGGPRRSHRLHLHHVETCLFQHQAGDGAGNQIHARTDF